MLALKSPYSGQIILHYLINSVDETIVNLVLVPKFLYKLTQLSRLFVVVVVSCIMWAGAKVTG